MKPLRVPGCELCEGAGGEVVARTDVCRVVLVDAPAHPGFCRVILDAHVKEMTDLDGDARGRFMDAVWRTEAALREVYAPSKINLASLGNQTPHLHWHVIPRFEDDTHYPQPVWAPAVRPGATPQVPDGATGRLRAALAARFPS